MLTALLMCTALAAPIQVDLHLDTPTQLVAKDLPLDAPDGLEAGLRQLRAGGTNVAVQVLWPPRRADWKAHSFKLLARLEAELARLPDVALATDPYRARQIVRDDRVALIVSMEGAHGLGTGPWEPVLDELYARGLRMLGLTWSLSNRFAGSSADQGGGLTEEGRALVAKARRMGIVLDVSHASRQTTMEVCQGSPVPVIASHSGAHSVQPHLRNLTDEEIRCIADTGGVIGVNFHAPFVGGDRDVGAVADHVVHMAKIGGAGVVALGSDYDGMIKVPRGLEHAGRLPALWAELRRRGWPEDRIDGLRGGNFLRAWAAVQSGASPLD